MVAEKFQITKRKAVAIVAATAVFAIVSASAATLGGVTSEAFGADRGAVVAPLEGGVTLSWDTAYSAEARGYLLEGIGIAATDSSESIPADAEVKVTILGPDEAPIIEYVSVNGGADWTTDTLAAAIAVEDVAHAAVVINGGTVAVSGN